MYIITFDGEDARDKHIKQKASYFISRMFIGGAQFMINLIKM